MKRITTLLAACVVSSAVKFAPIICIANLKGLFTRSDAETGTPALPLTASWLLLPDQGRATLGKVLERMQSFTKKKQILQSLTNAYLCNATLHK